MAPLPASAHDDLVSSSPAPGERLASAPVSVTLIFSDEMLADGAEVAIIDGSGRDWAAGEPVVSETTVSVELEPDMPEAGYEIQWRVVSSDGHPISDIVPFTVGDFEPLTRKPSPSSASEGGHAPGESESAERDSGQVLLAVLIGTGVVIVGAAAYAGIRLARRRLRATAAHDDGAGHTDRTTS
jgi:methionine-rich copper-binding protein CopC